MLDTLRGSCQLTKRSDLVGEERTFLSVPQPWWCFAAGPLEKTPTKSHGVSSPSLSEGGRTKNSEFWQIEPRAVSSA